MNKTYWLPFTANRNFYNNPKIFAAAKGHYYYTKNGDKILDGISGLWCSNLGHGRPEITKAVSEQLANLDYSTSFQLSHEGAHQLTDRLIAKASESQYTNNLKHVFFTNSGSESADTALKIALGFHKANGESERITLIGREKGYHGVCFGGMSVGGMEKNKTQFRPILPNTDYLPHLLDIERNAYSTGMPKFGIEQADYLEDLVKKHGADRIAAVIIEPFSGSAGVIVPPLGYLQRIREITKKYGILLIFDEVITAFGRVGDMFAAARWQVQPDMITIAKALTNGSIPMGAVLVSDKIYNSFMTGDSRIVELCHGFTYSGHPVACAAALACLDIYERENTFEQSKCMEQYFENAIHSLRGLPHIIDIRNIGLAGAIEFLAPSSYQQGFYSNLIFDYCFSKGLLIRHTGDIIAFAPPLGITKLEIDFAIDTLQEAILFAAQTAKANQDFAVG